MRNAAILLAHTVVLATLGTLITGKRAQVRKVDSGNVISRYRIRAVNSFLKHLRGLNGKIQILRTLPRNNQRKLACISNSAFGEPNYSQFFPPARCLLFLLLLPKFLSYLT